MEIGRIVSDIVHKCERQRVNVDSTLAAFVAKAVILENAERFQLDRKLYKADVDELVKMAVDRLVEKDSPRLETLKMQVGFDSAYVQQHEKLEDQRVVAAKAYAKLEQEICSAQAQTPKDVTVFNSIQNGTIKALLRRTNQDPEDSQLQREVAAALESVLPRANLHVFSKLPYLEKKARLLDLHDYVLGIRLFNRRIGKGGLGLADSTSEAVERATELGEEVVQTLTRSTESARRIGDVIAWGTTIGPDRAQRRGIPMERLQQELVNRRQFQTFVGNFQDELIQALDKGKEAAELFEDEMLQVQEMVSRKAAVPKEQVYPRFASMARAWTTSNELVRRLEAMRQIWAFLMQFEAPDYNSVLTDDLLDHAREAIGQQQPQQKDGGDFDQQQQQQRPPRPPSSDGAVGPGDGGDGEGGGGGEDPAAAAAAALAKQLSPDDQPIRVTRDTHPDIIMLPTELNGFCPVTFVDRDWLLLPGNPNIGNVLFREKMYAFMNFDSMKAFMRNPLRYLEAIVNQAQRHTELVNLLGLDEHFPSNILRTALSGLGEETPDDRPPKQDAECQTVLHVVEKNIDFKYDFNEWSLRRKALQLTNMRYKKTHSVQTEASHFRRENDTQTWLPKPIGTQTASTTGTAPIRKLRYFTGLRGHPDQITGVVYQELEIPLKGQTQ